jgi:hypothetical protein
MAVDDEGASDQGLTTDRPIAVPTSNRNNENAAAPTPPAAIAAHETAELGDSSGTTATSVTRVDIGWPP